MNNPYSSPEAGDSFNNDFDFETDLRFFSFSGRIGRLRYLAYNVLANLIAWGALLLISLIGGILGAAFGREAGIAGAIIGILFLGLTIAMLLLSIAITKRRFNDFNWSGWAFLLFLIPLVNLVMALILIFMPGTDGANNYGRRPPPNSAGVIIGALAIPVMVALFGILAAIALPAYQDYTIKAREAENRMLEERGINQDNNSEDYNDRGYSE